MMTINLCLIPLKKIIEINYTCGSLEKPMTKEILWRLTVFLFPREWIIEGGYLEQNEDCQRGEYIAKGMRAYILVSRVIYG